LLACVSFAVATSTLRADGIALSTDGLIWTKGVGGYGESWGNAGTGVSVQQGATVYIKYYSDVESVTLTFANHGRSSDGAWYPIGPAIAAGLGQHRNEPIILKISDIGTSKSSVSWINGRRRSGIWPGIPSPGPYDLALHVDAKWTLPPIVVNEAPRQPSFWASLFGPPNTSVRAANEYYSVPDTGATAILFAMALLSLSLVHRRRF
jgi:hypothetical protein